MKRRALVLLWVTCIAPSMAAQQTQAGAPDLARRLRAQAAVEDVYWRHRIWPEVNPGAKPALQQVMPQAALRAKTLDPLRKSAALQALWNRPVTSAALQSEIDRMVRDTHAPDILRELFAALDDDPALIAEVLARPLVADRLARRFYARDDRIHEAVRLRAEKAFAQAGSVDDLVRAGGVEVTYHAVLANDTEVEEAAANPEPRTRTLDAVGWHALVKRLASDLGDPAEEDVADARALPRGRLSALQEDDERFYTTVLREADATSVKVTEVAWPKQSFDEWWGTSAARFGAAIPETNGTYVVPALPGTSCTVGTWTPLRGWTPPARSEHTAVWTGSEMLVWGGHGPADGLGANVGGRYDPATDSWSVMGTAGSPVGRTSHTAIWTGTRMIVWGGQLLAGVDGAAGTGGLYDPITDSWTPTRADATAPLARNSHTAVWTGDRMIIFGGSSTSTAQVLANGGIYTPSTDTWLPVRNDATTASSRWHHTAIWTGSRMVVWGGTQGGVFPTTLQTGGRYDPNTDTWEATRQDATTPASRADHFAVWTGTHMVVWGGFQRTVPGSSTSTPLTSGAQYDPVADTWQPTRNDGTQPPASTIQHTVWTGAQWLLWGYGPSAPFAPTGRRYDPATDLWSPMSTAGPAPSPRGSSAAVWTGNEMIVWGGSQISTGRRLNTGGRYDPASDTWVATAADQPSPPPRFDAGAVSTGSEMIIWGGGENVYVKTGYRYSPATDSWQPILADATAPEARAKPSTVWTGQEMIVWGGDFNSGGRYNPSSDSWLPTRLDVSTPAARSLNTAVWTGTEMIVWGGTGSSGAFQSGGRYRPDTDTWIATRDDATAPTARFAHSAVWTGQQMIVWGGSGTVLGSAVNTGARYDPISQTWTPTRADASAPTARYYQSAVWTGNRMVIWGGLAGSPGSTAQAGGGRYDPVTDTWVSTALGVAPSGRYQHSAHWFGSEMIIWGGDSNGNGTLNSGGRYDPLGDAWIPTPLNATTPVPRTEHVSVISGNGLIVWGGNTTSGDNSGGELCLCSPATAWYRDVDGDGHGTASSVVTSCQQPAGYVAAAGDCNDADAASWSTPGEAGDLMFDDQTTLHWSAPLSPGGLQITYDLLWSDSPSDFVSATVCLASGTPSTSTSLVDEPPGGAAFYFRVRARNVCPGGVGSLGTDSAGTPVAGRACP